MLDSESPSVGILRSERLFGSANVTCPLCVGRTYVLYIEWERGGWYVDLKGQFAGKLLVPTKTDERDVYFADLDRLSPVSARVPIAQR